MTINGTNGHFLETEIVENSNSMLMATYKVQLVQLVMKYYLRYGLQVAHPTAVMAI